VHVKTATEALKSETRDVPAVSRRPAAAVVRTDRNKMFCAQIIACVCVSDDFYLYHRMCSKEFRCHLSEDCEVTAPKYVGAM
jgi:hypothetical protein